ncbi:MAG: hypothetical protein ACPGVP_05630 [Thiolinea sp.]
MKRLISPPIQLLLWLSGIACLVASGWSVWQLRQLNVDSNMAQSVKVEIPDAKALAVPGIQSYRKLVEAPLFWEERVVPRKIPKPAPVAVKAPEPEVVEVELNPPVGRLVGIVDLGDKRYALVRNDTENQSLYQGDTWEGWKVDVIDADKMVLTAGKQRTEISLIGDFAAPKPNKQMLASKQRQAQRQRQQQIRQQQRQRQQQQRANQRQQGGNNAGNAQEMPPIDQLTQALGGNNGQNGQQPAPVLSIKEALEARQRLMASRWGTSKPKAEGQ